LLITIRVEYAPAQCVSAWKAFRYIGLSCWAQRNISDCAGPEIGREM